MNPAPGSRHYCLIIGMRGVKLIASGSDHGSIVDIPAGSILQVQGRSALSQMVEARWRDDVYAVFEEDLVRRGQLLSALSRSA